MTNCNTDIKYCKTCGKIIIGRSDKIFCSYNCRVYFNNIKYRKSSQIYTGNKRLKKIYSILQFIQKRKSPFLLKIILLVAQICKIISTFDRPKNLLIHKIIKHT